MKHYKSIFKLLALPAILAAASIINAQPAKGANKFLGNITTQNKVRSDFSKYWNQITGENESKWGTVEGKQDKMSWKGTDSIAEYARRNGIPWKFHCFIWGSQYPSWMNNLSQSEQLEEITEWLDSAAARYPDVQLIDVINEAYPSHKPPPFKNALGGDGSTGYDWMIKIFKMTRERWPDALLIYNDYNTIEWGSEVDWQVKMATAMKKNNSEMDAIGVQAHDAWKVATNTVKGNIDKLAATGYPIVVSEYDIGESNDSRQKQIMQEQFTMFWNHPKIIGVTYWGYIVGSTWRSGTGLLNTNGTERPALTWLMDYVKDNPDPPNDYPDLLAPFLTGSNTREIIAAPVHRSNDSRNSLETMRIFDLRGRLCGTINTIDVRPAMSSPALSTGRYVVTVNNHYAGGHNRIR